VVATNVYIFILHHCCLRYRHIIVPIVIKAAQGTGT